MFGWFKVESAVFNEENVKKYWIFDLHHAKYRETLSKASL